ncbi:hypothetical protein LINPERPRIM_LOCUS37980 [Linum perenne]
MQVQDLQLVVLYKLVLGDCWNMTNL